MTTTMIADDEVDMRLLLRVVLELAGTDLAVIAEADDGKQALDLFRDLEAPDPDVVILDNRMPNMTGLEAAEAILRERPGQLVILYSAFLDDETRAIAEKLGIACCVAKDEIETMAETITQLVATRA